MVSPRNIRLVLASLVVMAGVGIVAAIFLKGGRTPLPEPVSQQLPRNIDVALTNARFNEMKDGVPVWELVADRAEYDKSGENAFLTTIRMVYKKNRANGEIIVTADKGEYFSSSRNVKLQGKVHVTTGSGMVMDTDSLEYQADRSLFRTKDRVVINHERLSLDAVGMELDATTEKTHFPSAVNAVVQGVQPLKN